MTSDVSEAVQKTNEAAPSEMSRGRFARYAALIAASAAQWSASTLSPEGSSEKPMSPEALQRFTREIRDILSGVEREVVHKPAEAQTGIDVLDQLEGWDGCWPWHGGERIVRAAMAELRALRERNAVLETEDCFACGAPVTEACRHGSGKPCGREHLGGEREALEVRDGEPLLGSERVLRQALGHASNVLEKSSEEAGRVLISPAEPARETIARYLTLTGRVVEAEVLRKLVP